LYKKLNGDHESLLWVAHRVKTPIFAVRMILFPVVLVKANFALQSYVYIERYRLEDGIYTYQRRSETIFNFQPVPLQVYGIFVTFQIAMFS
jgi:hypothetical protein